MIFNNLESLAHEGYHHSKFFSRNFYKAMDDSLLIGEPVSVRPDRGQSLMLLQRKCVTAAKRRGYQIVTQQVRAVQGDYVLVRCVGRDPELFNPLPEE
ncbi:hypothetical protein vBSlqSZDD2_57 [Serratia phage vB_SlqS_ZDD2]|nr:hypothetical protein vBSlqSZDD2_57 [Serratia phage vB_SlqS_ZDD2]